MVREDKTSWKAGYFVKIIQLLDEYPKCFLVIKNFIISRLLKISFFFHVWSV
jgi:large subunit ribosomal protein LP0